MGTLSDLSVVSKYSVVATIKSKYSGFHRTLEFLAVPSITPMTPDQNIDKSTLNIPANLQLADPEFNKPGPVQILLGAGTSLSVLSIGHISLSSESEPYLILHKTLFGWIVGGNRTLYNGVLQRSKCHLLNLQHDIARFWEIEEGANSKRTSKEEATCAQHFTHHVKRNSEGRYVVALPFNEKIQELGESYNISMKRLQALERRLNRQPELQQQYVEIIQDYISRGYIHRVADSTVKGYILPHQAVLKEASSTTKVRVVFDGSAASSSGMSLNDCLLPGPIIQDDIFALLIRFRLHNYVLTGDIEKMYLQVHIRDEDQKYLRILWRMEDGSVGVYQFNRLIFGLKTAGYLAIRCLHQLAEDESTKFPKASRVLKRDLYVDDVLTGADTIEETVELRQELSSILKAGGFNIRQFASNSSKILKTIPEANVNLQLQSGEDATLKTLGVHWNSAQDAIIYTTEPINHQRFTKRNIFSEIAKIFDPLGLLNPVIVVAKLIMQSLWKLQLNWDESVPVEVSTIWSTFIKQLPALNGVSVNRHVLKQSASDVHIHGFCDASEKAYGACIYVRSTDTSGSVKTSLYCAKSKVAPIKNIQTIPRLELCAALLLANLYNAVTKSMHVQVGKTFLWTDSTIALCWIRSQPHILKTFVANRVSEIQSKTDISCWRHVRTDDNPADLLSRGVLPEDFLHLSLWWNGPPWLSDPEDQWPAEVLKKFPEIPEQRKVKCLKINSVDSSILLRFSSFVKLRRVVAFCLRWLPGNRLKGPLTAEELQSAQSRIMRLVQSQEFPHEIKDLKKGRPLHCKSKLLALTPFIDDDQIIRVGGRLQHINRPYREKHPILLPKSHYVTRLLINHHHLLTKHGGIQTTLHSLRQEFWIIDGKNQIRYTIRSCMRCSRFNSKVPDYVMGNLPPIRATAVRPFTNVGVDYCGPFLIKEKKFRNRKMIKVYVAIFICMTIKAVHIEIVSELSTEGFLAALKRFVARRGICKSIYSDNGTNFVGANKELKELNDILHSEEHNSKVQHQLADQGISWHFSPPQSPHFGGLWESAVKSFKHHFKRVAGNTSFTYEELNTLAIEIEAILNSRPLTSISSDPNDFSALTPSHFLIGDKLSNLPEQDLSSAPTNRLSIWQHIQKVKQDFWTRWHKEYLNELNIRRKWSKGDHSIKEHSLVLIREDHIPPLQWRMGRVVAVHPGQDGIVRVATVKTASGEFKRCIKRLVALPKSSEE